MGYRHSRRGAVGRQDVTTRAIEGAMDPLENNHKQRRWLITSIVVVVVALVALFFFKRGKDDGGERYRTEVVDRGNVAQTVSATGTLSAVTTVQVGSQVSGIIAALHA